MAIELQGSLEGVVDEMLEGSVAGNIKLIGGAPTINELNVTTNGTYEVPEGVDGYNPVVVTVPERVPVIEELSVNANGTYAAPSGKDGYNPVVVNVPVPTLTTLQVDANGTYTSSPNVAYNRVEVNVEQGDMPIYVFKDGVWNDDTPISITRYLTTIEDNMLKCSGVHSGIVVSASNLSNGYMLEADIYAPDNTSIQVGRCYLTTDLDGIIRTGANRLSYNNINASSLILVSQEANEGVFIGGNYLLNITYYIRSIKLIPSNYPVYL